MSLSVRFEDEVMGMARELEEKEKEYEQSVMSLTSVVELAKVCKQYIHP